MKNSLFIIFISISIVLGLTSCTKKDDSPKKPTASFSVERTIKTYVIVKFTNTSINATEYEWKFDNKISVLYEPSYFFTKPGTYPIQLTAYNGKLYDTVTHDIIVY